MKVLQSNVNLEIATCWYITCFGNTLSGGTFRYVKEHPEDPNYENCKEIDVCKILSIIASCGTLLSIF
jgi:hypothetical protein